MPAGEAGGSIGGAIVGLVFGVLIIVSMWKVFVKAGEPGWAAIVPIYNTIVLIKIAGKPLWWLVLFCLPGVNLIALIMIAVSIAQRFGKGTGFGVGLALLPFVFYPLLAFGDGQYRAAPAGNAWQDVGGSLHPWPSRHWTSTPALVLAGRSSVSAGAAAKRSRGMGRSPIETSLVRAREARCAAARKSDKTSGGRS